MAVGAARLARRSWRSEPYPSTAPKLQNWTSSLVQSVREAQRSSLQWVEAWRALCDKEGNGNYDPARHDEAFLRWALKELGEPIQKNETRAVTAESISKKPSHEHLADEVKAWQRADSSNSQAWRCYCDEYGDGSYDPNRYDADFLRTAIAELQDGGGCAESKEELMEEVKAWQRSSMANSTAWRAFCDYYGDGSYDPNKYDAAFLQAALQELALKDIDPMLRNGASSHFLLVEEVKAWKRASLANTAAWRKHCDEQAAGKYDPAVHDAAFLQAALGKLTGRQQWRAPAKPVSLQAAAGPLTERVKEVQRSSLEATLAWRDYCDTHADGTYNPALHEAGFLRAWLAEMEGGPS